MGCGAKVAKRARLSGWVCVVMAVGMAATGASATPAGREADWRTVETVHPAGAFSSFALTIETKAGDEESPRLMVAGPRGRTLRVTAEGGLVTLAEGLGGHALPVGRRLRSAYVLTSARLATPSGEPILIVFGRAYGGDPGSIRVIALGRDGVARLVLSLAAFDLTHVEARPGGGVDLVGVRSLSQFMDKCRKTYDPFAYYRFGGESPGHFQYDLALSRAYTVSHMAGWAGPAAREDIGVDTCDHTAGRFGALVRLNRHRKG